MCVGGGVYRDGNCSHAYLGAKECVFGGSSVELGGGGGQLEDWGRAHMIG
jgi:hypothetical protein